MSLQLWIRGEEDRGALAAAVGPEEGPVATTERQRADRALGRVVAHLQAPVLGEAAERFPAIETVSDGFGEIALAADPGQARLEIGLEIGEEGNALRLADSEPDLGALAIDPALNGEERADLLQRLKRDRRLGPACSSKSSRRAWAQLASG